MTKRVILAFPIGDPNPAQYITAVFMLNICLNVILNLDLHGKPLNSCLYSQCKKGENQS